MLTFEESGWKEYQNHTTLQLFWESEIINFFEIIFVRWGLLSTQSTVGFSSEQQGMRAGGELQPDTKSLRVPKGQ